MARRKKGMPPIPNALSQAKDVFPITVLRNFLAIPIAAETSLTAANNDGEVVDLDLQFEDNEVFDIWAVKVGIEIEPTAATAVKACLLRCSAALYEDPDKADTTDLVPVDGSLTGVPAANYQDDSSLLYNARKTFILQEGATTTNEDSGDLYFTEYFVFPQPYTVGRNVKWILEALADITTTDLDAVNLFAEIWGRRRNATDAEFKNIIYRQRF